MVDDQVQAPMVDDEVKTALAVTTAPKPTELVTTAPLEDPRPNSAPPVPVTAAASSVISLENGWSQLVRDVFEPLELFAASPVSRRQRKQPFTNVTYSTSHALVYNMCTQRTPNNFSGELYERLGAQMELFTRSTLRTRLSERSGIVMVSEVLQFWWDSFWPYLVWTSRIFTYLDRYYVKLMHKEPLQIRAYTVFGRLVKADLGEDALRDGIKQLRLHGGHADRPSIRALEALFTLEEKVSLPTPTPMEAIGVSQVQELHGCRARRAIVAGAEALTDSSSDVDASAAADGADSAAGGTAGEEHATPSTAVPSAKERTLENEKDVEALAVGLWEARWELVGLPGILAEIRRFRSSLPFPEILRRTEAALRRAEAAHTKLFKGAHQRDTWHRIAAEAGVTLLRALEEQTDAQQAPGVPVFWRKTAERMPREVLHECVACLLPGCAP
jgi:hypothetical protein